MILIAFVAFVFAFVIVSAVIQHVKETPICPHCRVRAKYHMSEAGFLRYGWYQCPVCGRSAFKDGLGEWHMRG